VKFSYMQHHAHAMVNLAISHGDLIPLEHCEQCGKTSKRQLDSHHEDYSKPLEVVWLCRSCHLQTHGTTVEQASRHPFGKRKRIKEIARQVHENGDEAMSANDMMAKYNISLGSTSKIREMLKNRSGDQFIQ
jgi:hypothetical protein